MTPTDVESPRRCFLDAILVEPDDDSLRLIFADWLEENDESEYAEFVRVQVEIEAVKARPGWLPSQEEMSTANADSLRVLFRLNNYERESRLETLRRCEQKLLEDHWPEWAPSISFGGDFRCANLQSLKNPPAPSCRFRCGFVEAVTLTYDDFMTYGKALLACQPVREVRLTTFPAAFFLLGVGGPWAGHSTPNKSGWAWGRIRRVILPRVHTAEVLVRPGSIFHTDVPEVEWALS